MDFYELNGAWQRIFVIANSYDEAIIKLKKILGDYEYEKYSSSGHKLIKCNGICIKEGFMNIESIHGL